MQKTPGDPLKEAGRDFKACCFQDTEGVLTHTVVDIQADSVKET